MGHAGLMGRDLSELFEGIFRMRREGLPAALRWPMPVPTFAVMIPFAFTFAWLSLLFWAGQRRWFLVLVALVTTLLISTIAIQKLGNGPKISRQYFVDPLVSSTKDHEIS